MGSSKPPVADGYDAIDLEADIHVAARLTRGLNLALLAMGEFGVNPGDLEAVTHLSHLAADAAESVRRVCDDAPSDTDWFGLRPREAGSARRASS